MAFFGFDKPVPVPKKKAVIKKVIKKAVKKPKPVIPITLPVVQLTKAFIDFVKYLSCTDNKRRNPQFNKWAEQLQIFVNDSTYGHIQIQVVFNWYAQHHQELWKIESPKSFIKHFPVLVKRYRRSINPYPSQYVESLMLWLLRFDWNCCDDELEIIVSRSLWMIKQLKHKINVDKVIEKKYCSILNSRIGDDFDFIRLHFEGWFLNNLNTERIRFAEITKKKILKMVFVWLNAYGVNPCIRDRTVSQLRNCLKEIDFESVCPIE